MQLALNIAVQQLPQEVSLTLFDPHLTPTPFMYSMQNYFVIIQRLNLTNICSFQLRYPCLTSAATLPGKVRVNFSSLSLVSLSLFLSLPLLSLSRLSEVVYLLLDIL